MSVTGLARDDDGDDDNDGDYNISIISYFMGVFLGAPLGHAVLVKPI